MAKQARSIVEHDKKDHQATTKHSPIDREIFGELTERALQPATTEEKLFSSIAEYLASKGIGFAIARITGEKNILVMEALFSPNGTNLTSDTFPPRDTSSHPASDIKLISNLKDELEGREVLFMSVVDQIIAETGGVLKQAFGDNPIMITSLAKDGPVEEIMILCGSALDDTWLSKTKELAAKLDKALEIVRFQNNFSSQGKDKNWLFKYSKVGQLITDTRGVIQDVNQTAADLLGFSREGLISRNITDVIPDISALVDASELTTQVSPLALEVKYQTQGEDVRYLHVEQHPVNLDEKSDVLLRISDLTDRWRVEDMVRQLGNLNNEIKNSPSVGMFLQDTNGFFIHMNAAALEMLGYAWDDLRGRPWTVIVPEEQRFKVSQANLHRMRGESHRYEIQLLHKTGKRIDVLISESPYYKEGCYAGAFVFITDITSLRRAEAIVHHQNWELQRILDRFLSLNQFSISSLQEQDVQALVQQLGEELKQSGMTCVVATYDANELQWHLLYPPMENSRIKPEGKKTKRTDKLSLAVDLQDPSLILLQARETIFIEEPRSSMEGLVSVLSPFLPFMDGVESHPHILAPLYSDNRLFGVVMICGENLTSADIPIVSAFSNYLSVSLEKTRLITNTKAQARLGEYLAHIAAAIDREKDLNQLLNVASSFILEALDFPLCTFYMVDQGGDGLDELITIVKEGLEKSERKTALGNIVMLSDVPQAQDALRTGSLTLLQDSRLLMRGEREGTLRGAASPSVLMAMRALNESFGLVSFRLGSHERKLSQDEQIFLETSVGQIAAAVERMRLAELAALQAKRDQTISQLITHILASRDLDDVIQTAIKGVTDLLPSDIVCLTSFDLESNSAQVLGMHGDHSDILGVGTVTPLNKWDGFDALTAGQYVSFQAMDDSVSTGSIAKQIFKQGFNSWVSVPLHAQGEIIGALSVSSREPHYFLSDHLNLLSRLQDPLAIAITNAQNYTDARRQAREFVALHDLSLKMTGEMELHSLLRNALSHATELLDTTMGAVFFVDEATNEVTLVTELGLPVPPSILRLQKGQGLAGQIWEKEESLIVERSRDLGDPAWLEACYATGSAIGVPIKWEDEIRGVLTVFNPGEQKHFKPSDVDLLSRITTQVSLGIENVQEHEELTRRVNQLRVVNDVARRISAILVEDLLYIEIVRRVAHGLNLELVILFLVEGDELIEAASYYLPQDMYGIWEPIKLKIGRDGISGLVASEGEPVLTSNVLDDPNYLPIVPIDTKVQSVVGLPIKLKGEVTGVLLVGSEKLAAFDNVDVEALQALCAHISTCIDNARMYEETKEVQYRLAESEKLRALSLVTSGIAHDFNNILAVILSRAELALSCIEDEETRRHLEQVVATAKEGGETIHRLEGFAQSDKDKTDFTGVDINRVVEEALEICQPTWKIEAQDGDNDLQIFTELHADQMILGASSQLREVMVNLIFNALEAMPAGGTLCIKTDNKENGIELLISDTGIGMTPEMMQQVFIPFFTMKPGKIGLGLSVCYGILQSHAGTIDIQSEIGEGTTIKIWLPIYTHANVEEDSTEEIRIPALVEPATILVVEDDMPMLEGLVETFTDAGHKVLSASNGLKGFELFLEAGKLDIVFTDLAMPKLSGWELIEQLRAFDPVLPIVIFAGWGDVINPVKLRQFGVAKVIRKPFEMAKLHSTLYEVLAMRKRLDQT